MVAGGGLVRAGRAFVELFADDSKLVRGLKSAQTKLKGWGEAVGTIGMRAMGGGLAILTPLLSASKIFASVGSEINDMRERTGMGTDAIQELGYAAKMTGADITDVEKGSRLLAKAVDEAAGGSASAAGTSRSPSE